MSVRTRRSVLATAAVGAAAAGGVVLAGPVEAAPAPVSAPDPTRMTLSGNGLRRIDLPAAARPGVVEHLVAKAGERCLVTATLTTSRGGSGTLHADVIRLHDRGQTPHGGTASTLEQHLFTLPGGTLVGSGTADLQGRGTFAVMGGTGRYAGCRGSYTAQQDRSDLGGDGSARYDLVLELPPDAVPEREATR